MSPDTMFAAVEQRQLAAMGAYARNHYGYGIRQLTPEQAQEDVRTHGPSRAYVADREPRKRVRPAPPRQPAFCVDCGEDITHRSATALRCAPCAEKRRRAHQRLWEHNERNTKTRTCAGCGATIRPRAQLCLDCYNAGRKAAS